MSNAGKGDKWRPINKAKYDTCPLWKNIEKKNATKNKKSINKTTMKNNIAILLMFLGTILLGQEVKFEVLNCGESAIFGRTMSDGSYIEEIVSADHYGRYLTSETYAETLTPILTDIANIDYAQELYGSFSISNGAFEVRVAVDLFAWLDNNRLNKQLYKEYMTRVAEVGGEIISDVEVSQAPDQPGILERSRDFVIQQYQDHPIRSTLVTVGSILLLDYWEGGGLDAFGLLSSSGGGAGTQLDTESANSNTRGADSPSVVISGDNNNVNISQDRSTSPTPVFFPPQ